MYLYVWVGGVGGLVRGWMGVGVGVWICMVYRGELKHINIIIHVIGGEASTSDSADGTDENGSEDGMTSSGATCNTDEAANVHQSA